MGQVLGTVRGDGGQLQRQEHRAPQGHEPSRAGRQSSFRRQGHREAILFRAGFRQSAQSGGRRRYGQIQVTLFRLVGDLFRRGIRRQTEIGSLQRPRLEVIRTCVEHNDRARRAISIDRWKLSTVSRFIREGKLLGVVRGFRHDRCTRHSARRRYRRCGRDRHFHRVMAPWGRPGKNYKSRSQRDANPEFPQRRLACGDAADNGHCLPSGRK